MFNNLKLELIGTLNNFIIKASAAIVRGISVLPIRIPIFRDSNGFRLKPDMLKVCLLAIKKKRLVWVVLFKLQGFYLVKVRIPKGVEKTQVHLLKKKDFNYAK